MIGAWLGGRSLGSKYRKIEAAQIAVRTSYDSLRRAAFSVETAEPSTTINLSDPNFFQLGIGKRVLRIEHSEGLPIYSANALTPFGSVKSSSLLDFSKPSLLWGIDGNFDWNFIREGEPFATTDHCGRLQILHPGLVPRYLFWFLKISRWRYGFDRVYRASLKNIKAEVRVTVPIDKETGAFSIRKQEMLAESLSKLEQSRTESLAALEDVLKARINAEM